MRSLPLKKLFRILLIASFFIGACQALNLQRATETPSTATSTTGPTSPPSTTEPTTEGGQISPTEVQPTALPTPPFPQSNRPVFAVFSEQSVDLSPQVQQIPIAADFSNVSNPFVLSQSQVNRLAKDGVVVTPGTEKEFFTLYEKSRYDNVPVIITSDSLLHTYHLLFDKTLRVSEAQHFIPMLLQLNQAMLAKTDEVYQGLLGTAWEDAARRTVAYIGVGSKLLDPNAQIPGYAMDLVQAELALIDQAAGIFPSPIFPGLENGEDYTQYIPRGHYTRSEELKAYFRSMMWYGRMTFRLKGRDPETGRIETRSALLLTYALRNSQVNGKPAVQAWEDLYSPTVFFVGRSDDLTALQYGDVVDYVYGQGASLQTIADDSKLDQFIALASQLPPPRILGIVINDTDDEIALTKGLRFMGQRFVPDAYIFRELIYRNVGTQDHRRGLPKGLDLLAAMGSDRAYQILDQLGDTQYENYPTQMQKVKTWLAGLGVTDWTETLYNSWLYTFYPLLEVPGEGYPSFMRSQAWLDKQLNTSLGSWSELKHDTILYAKQVYAELGGGPPPPPPLPPRGYVEPVPRFFSRLLALTTMTRTGLEIRGLLSEKDREGLVRLEDLSKAMMIMAQKELRGELLTDAEYARIRYYGGELEMLTMLAAESESTEPGAQVYLDEEQQAAVIADVATDPAGPQPVALEVGVGRINVIHVVAPIVDGSGNTYLQVVRGGVFSYYEFPWPIQDRLTDEKWREMLDTASAPALPDWIASFFVTEGEYADIGRAVLSFQKSVVYIYWDPANAYMEDPALQPFVNDVRSLAAAKQYVGHELFSSAFRSFDLQSPTQAVVTVRETWQDKLYSYSGDYPNYDEQPISSRGPYMLDATYTLQYIQKGENFVWAVTQVVYASQPPNW